MFPDEIPFEEYEGPPGTPPKGDATSRNDSPLGPPQKWDSVSWDDVPCGHPKVVIPTVGPNPLDSIAARHEFKRLMSLKGEVEILVNEAVIEWLVTNLPGNQSEEAKAANERIQKIMDEPMEIEPWVEKALVDIRERLVPKYPLPD